MFRTVTAPSYCCAERDDCSHSSNASLLTVDTRGRRWRLLSGEPAHGSWRSGSDPTLLALRFCLNDGLLKGRSLGSVATAAWRATSSVTPQPLPHSSASP